MATFVSKLGDLADGRVFPPVGQVDVRWGQILRESPHLQELLERGRAGGALVRLGDLGRLRGGTVTRANAYFIVDELPFESIPTRFRITRRDWQRVAVVMDGLDTPHRIERPHLRTVLKGPDALLSATEVAETSARLVDIRLSKAELREKDAGALAYIRRGETVAYKLSEDKLKGGIPAERSNVKNRKPYWYSLGVPGVTGARIVLPEHYDRRYVATLLTAGETAVVIDKLFVVELSTGVDAEIVLASLNSSLTWYQLELRGRTQLGEGVLEVKVPDLAGLLVLEPSALSKSERLRLLQTFAPLRDRRVPDSLELLADVDQIAFDTQYLDCIHVGATEAIRVTLGRELRGAVAERSERRESVADAKLDGQRRRVTASVDAYASRIAAKMEAYPDPRALLRRSATTETVSVAHAEGGRVRVGNDLFTHNDIFVGDQKVASTTSPQGAQFVRGVLLRDPELTTILVPVGAELTEVVGRWEQQVSEWQTTFEAVVARVLSGIPDERTRNAIRARALALLHAS